MFQRRTRDRRDLHTGLPHGRRAVAPDLGCWEVHLTNDSALPPGLILYGPHTLQMTKAEMGLMVPEEGILHISCSTYPQIWPGKKKPSCGSQATGPRAATPHSAPHAEI